VSKCYIIINNFCIKNYILGRHEFSTVMKIGVMVLCIVRPFSDAAG